MKRVILVITLLLSSVCHAQTDTVFWFAAPDLSINHQQTPIRFCFTTYSQPATITVSQPANNSYTPFTNTLPADSFYVYDVSALVDSIETKPVNTVLNRGFLITSTTPISCYYESVGNNSEIYTLKGNNALGTDFVVPMQFIHPSHSGSRSPSSIEIIATEDSTLIQITAPVAIHGGLAANTTFTILLNRGQSYAIRSNGYAATDHLGGTVIHSNKPISVNSTDDSMNSEEGCIDLLGDQVVPTRLLGQRYVALRNDSQVEYVFIYPINTDS
ncbi:MAG: IgGFc-binding protein, partial [Bacteroidales bacterium]|nr:IgGFc-binding protein [Bacteroidales bacterium]